MSTLQQFQLEHAIWPTWTKSAAILLQPGLAQCSPTGLPRLPSMGKRAAPPVLRCEALSGGRAMARLEAHAQLPGSRNGVPDHMIDTRGVN